MSNGIDALAKTIMSSVEEANSKKTESYDTTATVKRVEDGIAWVHIPGGVEETPVRLTMNAEKGDAIQVRVSNGSAWITGNRTSPPTDDTLAMAADKKATEVRYIAIDAKDSAEIATDYANKAKDSADRAYLYAEQASSDASRAKDYADEANDYAYRAFVSAGNAETSAGVAEENAREALTYAQNANSYAIGALNSLGEVEKVIDALNWIAEHGEYSLTQDTEVQEGKWYFVRSGSSPNYIYTVVDAPSGNPNTQGWYQLDSVDTAISNYVASHLALTDEGLSLQTDGVNTRILLSAAGLVIKGPAGETVASYGSDTIIGNEQGFHIKIDGTELGFYDNAQKVAYINGNKLYITQSVVLQQMDIGTTVSDGGEGQWSWKVHKINNKNNLYLKWNG